MSWRQSAIPESAQQPALNPSASNPILPSNQMQQTSQPISNWKASAIPQTPTNPYIDDDEEIERQVQRHTARLTSRGVEQVVGLPGNTRELVNHVGSEWRGFRDKALKKIGIDSLEYKPEEGSLGAAMEKSAQRTLEPIKYVINKLPTSSELKNTLNEASGGFLKAQGKLEEAGDEVAEDIVSSVLNRGPKNFYRNFLVPTASNIVKNTSEALGFNPSTSYLAKLMTWLGLDLAGISNPRAALGNAFQANRASIPVNDALRISRRDLTYMDNLLTRLQSGGTSPSKTAAITKLQELQRASANGSINARELNDFYRTVNELKSNYGAFSVEGASKPAHVHNLNRVQDFTRHLIDRYGRNQNPAYLRQFRENNAAWRTLENSDAIAGFVKKYYTKPFISEGAKVLFASSKGAIPAVIGLGALERMQAMGQRLSDPTLRRYYGNILAASLQDNQAMMINNMERLDKEMAKREKTKPPMRQ